MGNLHCSKNASTCFTSQDLTSSCSALHSVEEEAAGETCLPPDASRARLGAAFQKFSEVSALVHLLYKGPIERTFVNVHRGRSQSVGLICLPLRLWGVIKSARFPEFAGARAHVVFACQHRRVPWQGHLSLAISSSTTTTTTSSPS